MQPGNLILTIKPQASVRVGDCLVTNTSNRAVRLAFQAPKSVPIVRQEIERKVA